MASCAGQQRQIGDVEDQVLDDVVVTSSRVPREITTVESVWPANAPMPSGGEGTCDGSLVDGKCAETFLVFYDLHHGYKLARQNDTDRIITQEFATVDVQDTIELFVWQDKPSLAGKRILCDCVGEWFDRDGSTIFLIRKATMRAGESW
jgi:hypothetical protein